MASHRGVGTTPSKEYLVSRCLEVGTSAEFNSERLANSNVVGGFERPLSDGAAIRGLPFHQVVRRRENDAREEEEKGKDIKKHGVFSVQM